MGMSGAMQPHDALTLLLTMRTFICNRDQISREGKQPLTNSHAPPHRVSSSEEENRWPKANSWPILPKSARKAIAWNRRDCSTEAEGLAANVDTESVTSVSIQRRRHPVRISLGLPRVEIVHDSSRRRDVLVHDGTALRAERRRSLRAVHFVQPRWRCSSTSDKYGCPCCRKGVKIAPVPATS